MKATRPTEPNRVQEWGNANGLECDDDHEVHHHLDLANKRRLPWKNSCRKQMVAWTKKRHLKWHKDHPNTKWWECPDLHSH